MNAPLLPLLLLLAGGAALVRVGGGRRGTTTAGVLAGGLLVLAAIGLHGDAPSRIDWVPELGLTLAWQVDSLAATLLGLVGTVLAGVVLWAGAWGTSPAHGRLVAGLVAFSAAMAGLLTSANLLTLFVFWELTTLASYSLIGFDGTDAKARSAARTSLLVTAAGGLALLAGAVLLDGNGATEFGQLATTVDPTSTPVAVGAFLLLLAAATKSAQVPFHGWLTGAMTAPTAASALLHAATLVVGGVHLVLRIAPFAGQVPGWTTAAVIVGLTTYVWAHAASRLAADAKQVLAGTTAAQMGLAFALAALGTPKATVAAIALVLVHGLYKSGLFLVVGTVAKRTGSKRIDEIAAGAAHDRALRLALWLGAAAMAGLPPLAGWVAKEAGVTALWAGPTGWPALAAMVLGTALAVAVAARLVLPIRQRRDHEADRLSVRHERGMSTAAVVPLLSGLLVLAAGLAPWLLTHLSTTAATAGRDPSFVAEAIGIDLVVWPGFVAPLAISIAALALGAVLVLVDRRRPPWTGPSTAPHVLADGIDLLGTAAARTASAVHARGRRTIVGTVLAVSVTAIWPHAVAASRWPDNLPVALGPIQLLAAATVVAGAIGVLMAPSRFGGALMLGVVGFAMGGLFVVIGAPDLLLTQVAVETVIVLVFAGVLRRLPRRDTGPVEPWTEPTRFLRAVLAVAAGLLVADLSLSLADSSTARPVATAVIERAVPDGGGTNAVNVVLTDFRAIDTLGELLVIFLSAAGALALARTRPTRSSPPAPRGSVAPQSRNGRKVAGGFPTPARRTRSSDARREDTGVSPPEAGTRR